MGSATDTHVELRGMAPRETVDVLDAVSTARRMSRNELVLEVLCDWVRDQVHVATVIARVTQSNGHSTEIERK